jgi:alpha-tubulin suppressor-like RCC1 family protein
LGQNSLIKRSSPVQVGSATDWSYISVGYEGTAAAINTSGELWTWGYGQLGGNGDNSRTQRSSPVQIPGTTWSQVSRGNYASGAIKTDGTLWTWGNGDDGNLGQNNQTKRSSPTQVPGNQWSKVCMGNWGQGSAGLRTNGTLWTWGRNESGQLGQGNTTHYSSPKQVPGTTWSDVLVGAHIMIGTKTDGTLWAWGSNTMGQLGQNNRTNYSSPKQIPGTSWALGPEMDHINGFNGGPIVALKDI